jgi:hypothetical protein
MNFTGVTFRGSHGSLHQNISGCIDITVMVRLAFRTHPVPDTQGDFFHHSPTS